MIELWSQRDALFCDAVKFLRHAREIDDFDRIESRSLLEFLLDRRESGARHRSRAQDADVNIGALAS